MTTLSTRAEFEAAQRATDRALRALFEQMASELAGIVSQAADANGVIPPAKAEDVRNRARLAVQRYFVVDRPLTGSDRSKELERLLGLIDDAQKAMRGATIAQKTQLRGRVSLLSKRIALLQKGTALVAFDSRGQGSTDYARALRAGMVGVVRDTIAKHTEAVKVRIADARTKIKS
jgi:hypothetical protein